MVLFSFFTTFHAAAAPLPLPEDEPDVSTSFGPLPFVFAHNFCLADVVFMGKVKTSKTSSIVLPNGHKDLFVDVEYIVELPYAGTSTFASELVRLPARHIHPMMLVPGKRFFVALDPPPSPPPDNFAPSQRFVSGLEPFPDSLQFISNSALMDEAEAICKTVALRIEELQ